MSDEEVTQEMVDQELHDCARYGELEDLKMMVDSDDTGMVNFNVVDDNGNSALHKAAANNHVEMMKYLVEHKSTYVLNSNKVGPLTWAVINKHIEAVKYLLDTFPENIDVLEKPEVGLSVLSTAYDVEAEDVRSSLNQVYYHMLPHLTITSLYRS
jgi:ankyrin repeat protein